MRRAGRLALLLGAALASWAQASTTPCVSVPGETELTIEHLGRVLFRQLSTDRAHDLVAFGGGVCLELGDIEVRVEAEAMVVRAPGPAATIEAAAAVVHAAGWRLGAETLTLDARAAVMAGVTIEGHGIVGRASTVDLDLERESMVARSLEVLTSSIRLTAAVGTFAEGDRLVVQDVVASTCDCPPESAPIRIETAVAHLELDVGVLSLDGGVLVVDGLRIALPATLRVTEASLAAISVPFTIGVIAEGDRGLVLGIAEQVVGGVSGRADLAFGADADPRWSAELGAAADGASVSVGARDGALQLRVSHRQDLSDDVALVIAQRSEGGAVEGRLQDASATLDWRRSWRLGDPVPLEVEARAALGVAATAQRRDADADADVVHPRVRLAGSVTATAPAGGGRLTLRVDAGATRYGGSTARQEWFGVAPRWQSSIGPVSIDLRHTWRHVAGASPFDDRVDRVSPVALSEARVAVVAGAEDAWSVSTSLEVRHDWRADDLVAGGRLGFTRLRAGATLSTPHVGPFGLAWGAGLTLEAAGLVGAASGRDAFVRGSVGVATEARAMELGVASEIGIGAVRPGVRSLTVSGAVPLAFAGGDVVVQPYLALDVWPLVVGEGAVGVVGHGLALAWSTCCGTLDLAYRAEPDGTVTTRLGFAVDSRVPTLDDLGR